MNADGLLACLLILERRVPNRHVTVDEAMAVAWLDDFRGVDVQTGMAAAKSWPQDTFPSATEFVAWCHSVARRDAIGTGELSSCRECDGSGWVMTDGTGHGTYRRCSLWLEQPERHRPPSGVNGLLAIIDGERARFLRLMREATAAASAKGLHWHGGPDPCPVCGGIRPDLKREPV